MAEDLVQPADCRANVYEFLSRIYLEELTPELLRALRDPACQETFRELELDLAVNAENSEEAKQLEDLAEAFCATFLVSDELVLYPYESCQREGCLQGESTRLVEDFYGKCGFGLPEETRELADHLGIEFDFMSKLAREEARWWEMDQTVAAERRRKQQKDFRANHLAAWVPRYSKSVERLARHPFYRSIGKLTFNFISMEIRELA